MDYKQITEEIIGSSYKVYNSLGFGFLESVYENSLVIELKKSKLKVEQQKPIGVYYSGEMVGTYKADLIVNE